MKGGSVMSDYILEMTDIIKEFPGVRALNQVNLKVKKGNIHALVGENGAGKSTLMNVLSGVYPFGSYEGDIHYHGEVCRFKHIRDSEKRGIAIIHQELALSPYMTIAENIYLGNEQETRGIIDWDVTNQKAESLMKKVGLNLNYSTLIKDIGVGHQQLVEIAKALSKDVELLILDEPTAALNDEDSDNLLNLLIKLNTEQNITCIIISHKLNEIKKIAHEITVIRDGSTIETLVKGVDEITEDRIIKGMVGRSMNERFPKRNVDIGEVGFEVRNWTVYDPLDEERIKVNNVSFNVRKGEVVGIAGLMGAGRTELAMSVFGHAYGIKITGAMYKDGKEIKIHTVKQAIEAGLAYLTEDRKSAGLVLIETIMKNISMAKLSGLSHQGVIDDNKEIRVAEKYTARLRIKASSILQRAGELSGGNQQKVIIAKWLFSEPDILILDEPTRGIDVGAKFEIYNIINELAAEGKCVIVISSEMPELLGISDRIYVLNEGRMVGEMAVAEASQEKIMQCIIRHS